MTIYTNIAANKRRSFLLLAAVFVLLVMIGYVLDRAYGQGTFVWLPVAAMYAILSGLIGYYSGDKIALWTSRAQPITKEQNSYLFRIIENLSITAGLPMPKVYVIEDPSINAFATGRDPNHASLAVTTGAIERLENEELEGVIAHELSHVGNLDIRYMTLVAVLVGTIVLMADLFWRMSFFGGFRGRRSGGRDGGGASIFMLVGLVLLILSPIIAQLIQLAVSRRREFLADASGTLLTRYPEGLAKALEKIGRSNDQPMARASKATAHLFIANPFGSRAVRGFARLFSTHPPIEERIAALRQMAS